MEKQGDDRLAPRANQPAWMHISQVANVFGDSDEMGDDLMDERFDQHLAEAVRQRRAFLQGTRLRFGRK